MDLSLEIETSDAAALVAAVAGADALPGAETVIDNGVVLRYRGTECRKGLTTELVIFALQIPVGISTSMLADIILRHMPPKRHDKLIKKMRLRKTDWVDSLDRNGNPIRKSTTRSMEIETDRQVS